MSGRREAAQVARTGDAADKSGDFDRQQMSTLSDVKVESGNKADAVAQARRADHDPGPLDRISTGDGFR
jgi:hypothetical protein